MSLHQLPLSLPTLILRTPPLLSTTPTAESSTARCWQWRILSLCLIPPIYAPRSHTRVLNTIEIICGSVSGPKNIQFTGLQQYSSWIHNVPLADLVLLLLNGWLTSSSHKHILYSITRWYIKLCSFFFWMHAVTISLYILAEQKYLNSLSGPSSLTMLLILCC